MHFVLSFEVLKCQLVLLGQQRFEIVTVAISGGSFQLWLPIHIYAFNQQEAITMWLTPELNAKRLHFN